MRLPLSVSLTIMVGLSLRNLAVAAWAWWIKERVLASFGGAVFSVESIDERDVNMALSFLRYWDRLWGLGKGWFSMII